MADSFLEEAERGIDRETVEETAEKTEVCETDC